MMKSCKGLLIMLFFGVNGLFAQSSNGFGKFVSAGGSSVTEQGSFDFSFAQTSTAYHESKNGSLTAGIQRPQLVNVADTLLHFENELPVAYHQRVIDSCGTLNYYLYPQDNHGIDSSFSVTTYVVESLPNDIDTIAQYNVDELQLAFPYPTICNNSDDVLMTPKYKPNSWFKVDSLFYNDWHFTVADKSLTYTQVIKTSFPICGGDFTVTDADGHEYQTIRIGSHCLTRSNLKSTHYDVAGKPAVPQALAYHSFTYPDSEANVMQYGRLYTWYSAVNLPEGSEGMLPVADSIGQVQGVCPQGWHLLSFTESEHLVDVAGQIDNPAIVLMSKDLWIQNLGIDALGFTAYPAGYYNSSSNHFESLRGTTYFWTVEGRTPLSKQIRFNCDTFLTSLMKSNDGASVRCVKNN